MNPKRPPVPVEQFYDPYDTSIVWYLIPGFNGYEINNLKSIRSFKYYHKYPLGIMVPMTKDNIVIISDDNNIRRKMKVDDLYNMAIEYQNKEYPYGYPHTTLSVQHNPRNNRTFLDYNTIYHSQDNNIVHRPRRAGKDDLFFPEFPIKSQ